MNKESINLPEVHSVEEALVQLRQAAGIASLMAMSDGRFELAKWATGVARQARRILNDENPVE